MKKIFVLYSFLITITTSLYGQNTIKVHTGFVGAGFVNTKDTKKVSTFTNLRAGVDFEKDLNKKIHLTTWATFDPGSNLVLFAGTSTVSISKSWKINLGYGGTPATILRPFPLSVDGQFQFTAEAIPPGNALGGYVSYRNTKAGIYSRNGAMEYHLSQDIGLVKVAGWISQKESSGITAQFANDEIYLMATVTSQNQQALATAIKPLKTSRWKIVHDLGVSHGKITNNLIGLLYPFETKKFTAARFGLAYDFTNQNVGVFWLIGLGR